jgi:hypothetical protein
MLQAHAADNYDDFMVHVIPKCGTHFMHRTLELLLDTKMLTTGTNFRGVHVGEDRGFPIRIFGPFDPLVETYMKQKHIKLVTVYRDPRDALISHLFYMRTFFKTDPNIGRQRDFFKVCANFDDLTFDEQLTALIKGTDDMMSYLDFYNTRIKWTLDSKCLGIKYEDLVGAGGGGDDKKQTMAIVKLANYINFQLTQDKLEYVLGNMYSKKEDIQQEEKTFVRASIGNWKTFFKPQHKKLFKQKLGKVLVKLGYEKNENW